MAVPNQPAPNRLRHTAAVLLAALMMSWPAIYNGFPLLYPDSMTYLDSGHRVARALFLHEKTGYYGMRSFPYAMGILPWHWGITPMPVVFFQALLTAWVLWLLVRSLLKRHGSACYLGLVFVLSALTSMSWYVSLIMPDFLGPVLYLCVYLWVFERSTLTRVERCGVLVLMWWALAAHTTHLILAGVLCCVLAALVLASHQQVRPRLNSLATIVLLCLLAVATHEALHKYLYGKASLNGTRGPFLMARLIADGPALKYLQENCSHLSWTVCTRLADLSPDPDNFIWSPTGVWATTSYADRDRMLEEEMPLALATLGAYPLQQIKASARDAAEQLTTFGYDDLDPSGWTRDEFDDVMPRAKASYLRGRQDRDAMPRDLFSHIQYLTTYASLTISIVLLALAWPRRKLTEDAQMLWLGTILLAMVLANGCITGALSMVDDRYQSRVVWLVPLLAGLLVLRAWRRGDWQKGS